MRFAYTFLFLLLTLSVLWLHQVTVADEPALLKDSTFLANSHCPGGTSKEFKLDGQVVNPDTYTLQKLKKLPLSQVTVSFLTGKGLETHTYIGVPLWTLIQAAGGVKLNPAVKNSFLSNYIVVSSTDCYKVVLSEGEFDPKFGAKQVLVAYATNDEPNQAPQPLASQGIARLVVPGDISGGRYVSRIVNIQVLSAL